MKTQFFTLFFTIICLSLQAQQPCIIEGNINGIPDGTVISLMRQQGTGMIMESLSSLYILLIIRLKL